MGTEIARETRSKSGNKCFGKMTEREIVDIFAKGKAGKRELMWLLKLNRTYVGHLKVGSCRLGYLPATEGCGQLDNGHTR